MVLGAGGLGSLVLFLCVGAVPSTRENPKANSMEELTKNFRGVKILEGKKNSYRYPIPGKTSPRVRPPKASRNFGENCTPTARRKKKPILGPLRIRYAGRYTYRYSRQAEKSLKTNSDPHACASGVPLPATCRYRGFDVIAAFGGGLRGQEPREKRYSCQFAARIHALRSKGS